MGSSSACIDTPLAAQEQQGVAGREVTGVCLLVAWQYTFSSFFTQQKTVPLFFFCCNSVISQTKEAQTESVICFLWILFLFLSQSSSVEAAQATSSSSVFCHGKKN